MNRRAESGPFVPWVYPGPWCSIELSSVGSHTDRRRLRGSDFRELMDSVGEVGHCVRLFFSWTSADIINLCAVLAVEVFHRLCSLLLKQPDLVGSLVAELVVLKILKRIVRLFDKSTGFIIFTSGPITPPNSPPPL